MAKFQVSPISILVIFMVLNGVVIKGQNVPAMFIFGDSLIDNGNNNNMASLAKANYFPYGIDFNGGPTGRFSNGYTMVDEIGILLHSSLIHYFLTYLYVVFVFTCMIQFYTRPYKYTLEKNILLVCNLASVTSKKIHITFSDRTD